MSDEALAEPVNQGDPHSASRSLMAVDTEGWEMFSFSAARVMLWF